MDQKTLRTESLNRRESSLTSQDEKTIFVLLGWNYRYTYSRPKNVLRSHAFLRRSSSMMRPKKDCDLTGAGLSTAGC